VAWVGGASSNSDHSPGFKLDNVSSFASHLSLIFFLLYSFSSHYIENPLLFDLLMIDRSTYLMYGYIKYGYYDSLLLPRLMEKDAEISGSSPWFY
jgi:hypothetical protein